MIALCCWAHETRPDYQWIIANGNIQGLISSGAMSEARLAGSCRAFSWGYISKKLIMGRNMGSLMFMVAGLFFAGISILAKKTREKFIAESFLVTGKIVDIKESRQRSGDASTVFYLPIIEYKTDSLLRFQAEIDADQHSLQVGEFVDVLVSKANHKVAKLKKSTKEVYLLLNLMLFLGVVACGLSVYLFYISDVDFSIDPFIAGIAAMSIASVLFSLSPMIKNVIDRGPSYVENAYEVAEDNS